VNILGIAIVILFAVLLIGLASVRRGSLQLNLREIPAFARLSEGIGLAVEAGTRLHHALGSGGLSGLPGASTLLGLSVLQRLARAAAVSDFPPVATSGEATQSLLSQDTLHSASRATSVDAQFNPINGQLSGVTPFSYAAGTLPIIFDQNASVNVLTGSFGSEAGLIADAAERAGGTVMGGSENIPAQAILYAATPDVLIGEEFFATAAYLQAGPTQRASLLVQDIFRWLLILALLAGAALKLAGVL
jgi:hypothetical protein